MKNRIIKIIIYFFVILGLVSLFLAIPYSINRYIICNSEYSKATNDGWTSFFGSYLGAIIGGVISLFVAKITLNNEFKHQKKQEDENNKKRENSMVYMVIYELECNLTILYGYLEYLGKEGRMGKINGGIYGANMKEDKLQDLQCSSWDQAKSTIFLCEDKERIREISKIYKSIIKFIATNFKTEKLIVDLQEEINNTISYLNK